jgi:hypothetical protein
MAGRNGDGSEVIDDLIARFVEDVESRHLYRRDEITNEVYNSLIEAFEKRLPWYM